jgi:predicted ABC-type ATPase
VSFEAGRIMLHRIDELLQKGSDFAFETTLSTRSYPSTIRKAQEMGYFVTLVFFWLKTVDLAKQRVQMRVNEGGHNIPLEIIERRYSRGILNFFEIYLPICDNVMLFDNSDRTPILMMQKVKNQEKKIVNASLFHQIKNYEND